MTTFIITTHHSSISSINKQGCSQSWAWGSSPPPPKKNVAYHHRPTRTDSYKFGRNRNGAEGSNVVSAENETEAEFNILFRPKLKPKINNADGCCMRGRAALQRSHRGDYCTDRHRFALQN